MRPGRAVVDRPTTPASADTYRWMAAHCRRAASVAAGGCRTRIRTAAPRRAETVWITETASASGAYPKRMEIPMPYRSRFSILSFAGVGAIAATALATAPAALAATSGGAPATPAVAHSTSPPFTIGLSATTVKPGANLTISGLAYARAGVNVTIVSNAIASGRCVGGVPAVQTPALVEGIYHATVRIAPATKPGVYPVRLRFGGRRSRRSAACASSRPARPPAATRRSTRAPELASRSCTTIAPAPHAGAATRSPTATNVDCGTGMAELPAPSSAAPESRSPDGRRPRRAPVARPSPSATAG